MSTIIKRIFLTLFISSFYLSFAQVKKERNYITIYIDLKDKAVRSYSIYKDTMGASFSIYIEKYESKKERDKAIQKYKNRIGDPDSVGLPSFSFAFYVFNRKPEKLKSLDGIKYITIKEFRKNNYKTTSPTFIIHKLKDGTYLRWKTYTME
jgi:hypothetical protein